MQVFCLLCKYNMYYIFVILLFPVSLLAGDMDNCNQEKDHDKKNMCMALAVGSVSYCEKLKKADDKMSCTLKVRDLQRKVMNQYHPMSDSNTEKR